MKTKLLLLLLLANFSIYAQYTSIPDVNFEKKLISLGIDSGTADGKVLTANVNKLTSLDVAYSKISDITGIQDFVALKDFRCAYNQISKLDISKNLALTSLDCYDNLLSVLDVSKNLNIEELRCGSNQLTALDVSKNVALTVLYCNPNKLTVLDVSKNLALRYLICSDNQLTALDVSNNTALVIFYCESNKLKSLNFKNGNNNSLNDGYVNFIYNPTLTCIQVDNTAYANANWSKSKDATATFNTVCTPYTLIPDAMFEAKLIALDIDKDGMNGKVATEHIASLKTLDVSNAGITNLSGIEDFAQLETLNCSGNNYTKIDFSKNFTLKTLNISKNANLESINLRNGKNTLLTTVDFKFNPLLRCIQVDDVAFATAAWSNFKDSYTSFNTDCTIYTLIPDPKFEAKLIALGLDKDGINGKVDRERIATLKSLTVSNSSISDLTGIEDFVALTDLYCDNNLLTKLDVSKNVALTNLRCNNNQLTTINVSKSVALTTLYCNNNKLTALDVSKSSILNELRCNNNQITTLDVSNNTTLTFLYCFVNKLTALDVSKNPALYYLYCSWNQITALDVSKNTALGFLDCYNNKLTALDISKNTLFYLNCELNQISTLDVSNNLDLHSLYCNSNKLNVLDVSKNAALSNLNCRSNQITALDVSNNLALGSFDCSDNKLTVLDVSKNLSLSYLNCKQNQLSTLDLSKNAALTYVYCNSNKLTALNVKNGKNTNLLANDFTNNPSLTCIQVDDVAYSNTNWANIKDAAVNYNVNCSPYTLIPDPKFEQKLIDLRIDTDGLNGSVLTSSINTVTEIDVSFSEITDLTGIQDFSALTKLFCGNNQLKNIDVSKNTALKQLMCESNTLTKLDVSKNAALTYLKCDKNQLTTLDVKINTALIYLSFSSNQITNIDVSKNTVLSNLFCSSNLLSNIDVSKNTALVAFYCDFNQLTNIDISKNTILNYFYCDSNQLTNLNISNNIVLSILTCSSNQLTALDISKNTALAVVICNNNRLTSLNLKNGKNSISPASFDSTNNPNLKCIQVDDIVYANTNWVTKKDTVASFNVDCTDLYTNIPDINFEKKLISLGIDTGVPDGKALTPNLASITSLDVSLSNISDLTGIQDFSALKFLKCNDNLLKNLDISKNTSLVDLFCFSNQLISLDVSNNTALINLSCYNNRLTDLNISKNTALVGVNCDNNQLITLNLKNGNNTILHFLNATNNPNLSCIQVDSVVYANANWITSKDAKASYNVDCTPYTLIPDSNFEQKLINLGIDTDGLNGKVPTYNISTVKSLNLTKSNISDLTGIQDFVSLTDLYCGQNSLTTLSVSKNTALTTLDCNNNKITSLDVSNNIALLNLSCYANQLTALDVKVNTALTKLDSGSNKYAALDVSSNTALTFLGCNTSQLTSLDVSKNTALTLLDCRENKLTQLDVSKNTTLTELYCQSNQLTNVDISKNKALEFLNCSKNQLTTLDVSVNTALVGLYANSNQLTSLNLKNANNVKFAYLNLIDNPNLSCIQVDDSNYFNTNWVDKKDKNASYNTNCTSYTQIPDSNFEQKLIDLGIDSGTPDGKVLTSAVSNIISLDLSSSNITDLTGIENFTSLKYFFCNSNKITAVDFSKNLILENLDVKENNLTSLNVSKNTKLHTLEFAQNQISSIDLSQNINLLRLGFNFNKIADINLINNNLTELHCRGNSLTKINLTDKPNLAFLEIGSNKIELLNLTSNKKLEELECASMGLTSLNVSENKELVLLNAFGNELTSLDVSQNPKLKALYVEYNPLTTLNLKNGNNKNFILANPTNKSKSVVYTSFLNNPNLTCIQVDNVEYSNMNWSKIKDANANFNIECFSYTAIPDINFENKLIALGLDSGTPDGKVLTSKIDSITEIDLYYSNISDLTGIQDFKALTNLSCMSNQLTTVDLSKNLALTSVNLGYNKLKTLNTSKNISLEYLSLFNNEITNLDLSQNNNLMLLACGSNQLTTLDVSNNKKLSTLWCPSNQLTSIDVSKTSVTSLLCSENKLLTSVNLRNGNNGLMQLSAIAIDFTKNPLLTCILVDNALYSNEKWANFKDATASYSTVDCSQITAIPDPAFEEKLIALKIDNDGKNGTVLNSSIKFITSLNVLASSIKDLTGIEGFTGLSTLNCSGNQLSSLNVSQNKNLTFLDCSSNKLLSLNLKNGNNKNLDHNSYFAKNLDLTCIQVDDQIYSNENWSSIKDKTANYNVDCTSYTQIPDSNFEQKLIDLGIDKDGLNGKISTANIASVTSLDLSNSNITDLTGIENFTALTSLDCKYNSVTTINVENNISLRSLDLYDNKLTALDVRKNVKLVNLTFGKNQISTIDLSHNTELIFLNTTSNLLGTLDLKSNPLLSGIDCSDNNLAKLDVLNAPDLTYLVCGNNSIAELNLSTNTKLVDLYCYNMKLTALDLNKNVLLKRISASWNQLTTLDLSHNPNLELVSLEFNPLTSLNVQNGNNKNFIIPSQTGKNSETAIYTSFLGNKTLGCIKVDDPVFSNANWSKIKEQTTIYSATCSLGVEESIFDKVIVYPIPTKGEVNINNIALDKVTVYNTIGQLVKSFTLDSNNTNNTIDLFGLPKGVYYMYLISQDAVSAKKIIIE